MLPSIVQALISLLSSRTRFPKLYFSKVKLFIFPFLWTASLLRGCILFNCAIKSWSHMQIGELSPTAFSSPSTVYRYSTNSENSIFCDTSTLNRILVWGFFWGWGGAVCSCFSLDKFSSFPISLTSSNVCLYYPLYFHPLSIKHISQISSFPSSKTVCLPHCLQNKTPNPCQIF